MKSNIRLNYLRVKIQSLCDEAKDIRRRERKADNKVKEMITRTRLANYINNGYDNTGPEVQNLAKKVFNSNLHVRKAGFGNALKKDYQTGLYDWVPDNNSLNVAGQVVESSIARTLWLRDELRAHRYGVVRKEARAAQLAYAFLRGKSFFEVEPNAKFHGINPRSKKNQKFWHRVEQIVYYFGNRPAHELKKELNAWKDDIYDSYTEFLHPEDPIIKPKEEPVLLELDWNNAP